MVGKVEGRGLWRRTRACKGGNRESPVRESRGWAGRGEAGETIKEWRDREEQEGPKWRDREE